MSTDRIGLALKLWHANGTQRWSTRLGGEPRWARPHHPTKRVQTLTRQVPGLMKALAFVGLQTTVFAVAAQDQ